MPSINDILNGLGVEDSVQEKTAGQIDSQSKSYIESEAERLGLLNDEDGSNTTKTASNNNGGMKMNLNDLYNESFGEVAKVASQEENAAEPEMAKEASLEQAGEQAGEVFAQELNNRLMDFSVKVAMEMGAPDSEATKAIQAGKGILGASANPQLPVNKAGGSEKMDTTPVFVDLKNMAGPEAKAKIEAALASGNIGDLSHKDHQVDTGLEMPTSQKTAGINLTDLSKEELMILNTEYSDEEMDAARIKVASENEKIAELTDMASECFNYGAELAMQKIAEMEDKAKESAKEEASEGKAYEDAEKAKGEKEEDEEKTASAMGKFILEGYWNTMLEKGAEFHGSEGIYLEELLKESEMDGQVTKMASIFALMNK